MTAKNYTSCISHDKHIGKVAAQAIIAAAVVAIPIIVFGGAIAPGLGVIALTAIIAYCRWWLYDRLICLGGDRCAVGWVGRIEPPSKKTLLDKFDTDLSVNLVLAPLIQPTLTQAQNDPVQGELLKSKFGLEVTPVDDTNFANIKAASLHVEFEGGGVYDLMIACLAALPFAVAATVVCAIPVVGWIACAILGAIAALITVIGIIAALLDTGDPNDVNPALGELHTNDVFGRGADILVVKGRWVYDSAHEGWNEIHPITHCQRIGEWSGSWWGTEFAPPHTREAIDRWCEKVTEAGSDETIHSQSQPVNTWTVHPVIDGCHDDGDPPPPIR